MDLALGQAQDKQTARKEQMEEVREVHDFIVKNSGLLGIFMGNVMGNITSYNQLYSIWACLKIRYNRHTWETLGSTSGFSVTLFLDKSISAPDS